MGFRFHRAPPQGPRDGRQVRPGVILFTAVPKRVNFYIDHRNFHHRLEERLGAGGRDFRWLDYRSLCESLTRKADGEKLSAVNLFTVSPLGKFHGADEVDRHNALVAAQQSRGVRVSRGLLALRPDGGLREKKTDVNLAVQMAVDALRDRADIFYLVSDDVDFVAALRAVAGAGKVSGLAVPPRIGATARADDKSGRKELEQCASRIVRLTFESLNGHSLPQTLSWRGRDIKVPAGWSAF